MPTYKLATAMERNGVYYPFGSLISLEAGPERDRLVELDVIYRPDIGPRAPRGWGGDHVLLPCKIVRSPEFPKRFDVAAAQRAMLPADVIARLSAADAEGYSYLTPLDEWQIPDAQWPPANAIWAPYPRGIGPARLRPIY